MSPAVTVLMTTFNGARTIRSSIDSVLAQRFRDYELVIVDDCSTDGTPAILAEIDDPRVRVVRNDSNGGIVAARNRGFAEARGSYIAALDHDDLSHPDRLERQVGFLETNPGVVLLATEVRIERDGQLTAPHHPAASDPLALRWLLLIDNPLTWSSVMFRADAVRRLGAFLRPDYILADDFDFFHRLLAIGDIARLDAVLTTYRYHTGNASLARAAELRANAARVLQDAYARWLGGGSWRAAELAARYLCDREPVRDRAVLDELGAMLEGLFVGFSQTHALSAADRARIAELAGEAWWRTVRAAVRSGAPSDMGRFFERSPLCAAFRPRPADVAVSLVVGAIRSLRRAPSGA